MANDALLETNGMNTIPEDEGEDFVASLMGTWNQDGSYMKTESGKSVEQVGTGMGKLLRHNSRSHASQQRVEKIDSAVFLAVPRHDNFRCRSEFQPPQERHWSPASTT